MLISPQKGSINLISKAHLFRLQDTPSTSFLNSCPPLCVLRYRGESGYQAHASFFMYIFSPPNGKIKQEQKRLQGLVFYGWSFLLGYTHSKMLPLHDLSFEHLNQQLTNFQNVTNDACFVHYKRD